MDRTPADDVDFPDLKDIVFYEVALSKEDSYLITGNIKHFPIDNYFYEGKREAIFLKEPVIKYHRTLTTYLNTLLENDFELQHIIEPQPPKEMMNLPKNLNELIYILQKNNTLSRYKTIPPIIIEITIDSISSDS